MKLPFSFTILLAILALIGLCMNIFVYNNGFNVTTVLFILVILIGVKDVYRLIAKKDNKK